MSFKVGEKVKVKRITDPELKSGKSRNHQIQDKQIKYDVLTVKEGAIGTIDGPEENGTYLVTFQVNPLVQYRFCSEDLEQY